MSSQPPRSVSRDPGRCHARPAAYVASRALIQSNSKRSSGSSAAPSSSSLRLPASNNRTASSRRPRASATPARLSSVQASPVASRPNGHRARRTSARRPQRRRGAAPPNRGCGTPAAFGARLRALPRGRCSRGKAPARGRSRRSVACLRRRGGEASPQLLGLRPPAPCASLRMRTRQPAGNRHRAMPLAPGLSGRRTRHAHHRARGRGGGTPARTRRTALHDGMRGGVLHRERAHGRPKGRPPRARSTPRRRVRLLRRTRPDRTIRASAPLRPGASSPSDRTTARRSRATAEKWAGQGSNPATLGLKAPVRSCGTSRRNR
jgi:hypothetical protein